MKPGNTIKNIILCCSGLLFIQGCEIINPEEQIPSYVYINEFSFTTSLDIQGYASSKLPDAWVYANNEFIGAFELPTTIPILADGETEIIVYPGIKENGISGTGMIYPFYNPFTITRNLIAGATDTLSPSTTYKNSAAISFLMIERFESSNPFYSVIEDASLTTTSDETIVFEGNRSAISTMTGAIDTFYVQTSDPIFFPTIDHQLFLELDYKCDIPFNIWVKCNTATGNSLYDEVLTITSKENWNKIYVNLNATLQYFASFQPESYHLEFRAINTLDTATIMFDNIKIIQSK